MAVLVLLGVLSRVLRVLRLMALSGVLVVNRDICLALVSFVLFLGWSGLPLAIAALLDIYQELPEYIGCSSWRVTLEGRGIEATCASTLISGVGRQ